MQGVKESQYQVLVDLFAMARLEWRAWDMFMEPSLGSVAYNEKTFVGQIETEGGERRIAELDYHRGMNGEFVLEVSKTEGWVLVEREPIKYSLENVTFLSEKVVDTEEVQLGSVVLEQEGEAGGWTEVSERLRYDWSGQESWGNIGGTVRGLTCSVSRGEEEEVTHTRMGLTTTSHHTEDLLVSFSLLPGTRVNISVTGEMVSLDQTYTATLLSVHKDGSLTVRNMTGVRTTRSLTNINYKHSGPVWLQSGLPAPTTAKPRTTSTTPTTSSPPVSTVTSPRTVASRFRAASPTPTLFPPPAPPVSR